MEGEKTVQVCFGPDEADFYSIILKRCSEDNVSFSDYVKAVIKKDLAWGRLARRKKTKKELK